MPKTPGNYEKLVHRATCRSPMMMTEEEEETALEVPVSLVSTVSRTMGWELLFDDNVGGQVRGSSTALQRPGLLKSMMT